jgi:hypothetical protein
MDRRWGYSVRARRRESASFCWGSSVAWVGFHIVWSPYGSVCLTLMVFNSQTALGSIATGIQSSFYGPLTTGVFSSFQYLGATAVVAPPATLVSGSGAIAAGIGCLAYYHWKKQVGPKAVKERET